MTAKEFIEFKLYITQDDVESVHDSLTNVDDLMVEFAKFHVEKCMNLQISKYYAGETGYITEKEWDEILNNVK